MHTASQILEKAMRLPASDRSYIVDKLLDSIEQNRELSSEWMNEEQSHTSDTDLEPSEALTREKSTKPRKGA